MKKGFVLISILFCTLSCGRQPLPARDTVDYQVKATLTAISQVTPIIAAPPGTDTPVLVQPTTGQGTEDTRLSLNILWNAVYRSPDWGEFQLSDGVYYRPPPTSQESPETYKTQILDIILYGDINLDGIEDALVFLATQNGGTGHFVEMAAVINIDGSIRNISSLYLGDRVIIRSGTIQDGLITINLLVQGPNDGACCPSQSTTWKFRLADDQLVRVP